jgi:hypothetical protein
LQTNFTQPHAAQRHQQTFLPVVFSKAEKAQEQLGECH